jgi:hypothetical protein
LGYGSFYRGEVGQSPASEGKKAKGTDELHDF